MIEMADRRRFVMKGMTSFMTVPGYDAGDARAVDGNYFGENPSPAIVKRPVDVVDFVVDAEPGWVRDEPEQVMHSKRTGWFYGDSRAREQKANYSTRRLQSMAVAIIPSHGHIPSPVCDCNPCCFTKHRPRSLHRYPEKAGKRS